MPFALNAPAGVTQFESRSGNQYTVSSGVITVPLSDLADAIHAGFTQTSLSLATITSSLATIQPAITKSALPTVSFTSATGISGAQTIYAINGSGVPNTSYFGIWGAVNVIPRNGSSSNYGYNIAWSQYTGSTYQTPNLTVNFYHSGPQLDILLQGLGQSTDIWVDDQYLGHWAPYEQKGTAQAGSSSSITLSSGASSTSTFYNTCYVLITGGTGSGQIGQISAYNGATKVATMVANWTTAPDATSTYVVIDSPNGYYGFSASDNNTYHLNLNFGSVATRKITLVTGAFLGVTIGANDTIWPAPPTSSMRMVQVGDSIMQGTGRPFSTPIESTQLARLLGWQEFQQGGPGSGWCSGGTTGGLNFMDRIAPPAESFNILFSTSDGSQPSGTFTLSLTYGGSTQTTSTITYSTNPGTLQSNSLTALNALSNMVANAAVVANGDYYSRPLRVLLHNMPGAVLTVNASGMTGTGFSSSISQYVGDVAPVVPKDNNGNALPFVLYVQGSGNDRGSYTAAQVQANAMVTANYIRTNFPTAIAIFTGVVSPATLGTASAITAADVAYNTAIRSAAALLPTINGNIPFIDTYAAGVGGNNWIFGAGNVAAPTSGTNDIFISNIDGNAHPTGNGHSYVAARMAQKVKALFGAQ